MLHAQRASFKVMYNGVTVECVIEADETGLTPDDVKGAIDWMLQGGFKPPVYSKPGTVDVIGKRGTVKAITKVEGTKMWEVLGVLDDGGAEFRWREFSPTSFRIHDRFEVFTNDRGFKQGQLIDEQAKLFEDI